MIANTRVEDCEVVTAGRDHAPVHVQLVSARCFGAGERPAFLCPQCGTRRFKLYRPPCSPSFCCRTSSQKQDSRLNARKGSRTFLWEGRIIEQGDTR